MESPILLLLVSAALAAEPGSDLALAELREVALPDSEPQAFDWWYQPTATRFEPVTPGYLQRHRELMDRVSAGRGASPLYRDAWTRMDVHCALMSWGVDGVYISPDDATRYRDLAFAAATLAGQDLLNETIDQAPGLAMARDFGRAVLAPGFELKGGRSGPQLRLPEAQSNQRAAQEAAALKDAPMVRHQGAPPPSVRVASGWALRPMDPDDPNSSFDVAYGAWLLSRNLAADALRLSVDVVSLPIDDPTHTELTLAWSFTAREELTDGWYWLAEARSLPGRYDPRYVRSGVAWQFLPSDPRWNMRSTYTYGFERALDGGATQMAEHRVDVRVQWLGPWVAPAAHDRFPLGEQVDNGPGPTWPTADRGPTLRTPPVYREPDSVEQLAQGAR